MNVTEFKSWIAFHKSLFSGFGNWYSRQEPKAIQVWADGMAGVSLKHAEQASREMITGDLEQPQGFGKHLAVVRRRAMTLDQNDRPADRPEFIDGQRTFTCRECLDTGVLSIYDPNSILNVMEGSTTTPNTCAVACRCNSGTRYRSWLESFDPDIAYRFRGQNGKVCETPMIPAQPWLNTDEQLILIRETAAQPVKSKRIAAFDAFNAGGNDQFV